MAIRFLDQDTDIEVKTNQKTGSKIRFIDESTPTGLPSINQPTNQNQIRFYNNLINANSVPQAMAQVAEIPQRGGRSLGVGVQRLIEGVNPLAMTGLPTQFLSTEDVSRMGSNLPMAIERANEALSPTFRPEEGEGTGAFFGETIGSLPIGFALGGFVAPTQLLRYKLLGGALGGAALSAIDQMAEQGFINRENVTWSSVIGGGIPLLKPTFQGIKNSINGIKEVLSSSAKLRPGTVSILGKLGRKLKDIDGTSSVIKQQIDDLQQTAFNVHEEAGEELNKTRQSLDLPATLKEKGERRFNKRLIEESVPSNPSQVRGNPGFVEVKINDMPLIIPRETANSLRKELVDKYGEDIVAGSPKKVWNEAYDLLHRLMEGNQKGMDQKAKLKTLDFLREKIGDYTDYARSGLDIEPITKQDAAMFNSLLEEVNKSIENVGDLGKKLRDSEKLYGQIRKFYDNFQSNFSTPDKASRTILGLLREEKIEDVMGTGEGAIQAIELLEKKTGKKIFDPLSKSMASRNIKQTRATNVGDLPARVLGSEGMPSTVYGLDRFANAMGTMGNLFISPLARIAAIASASTRENR